MICGIDEAGRGPLAGPVCAAAVILPAAFPVDMLDDSKKMKAPARKAASRLVFADAVAWGIGWASAFEIDKINILNATLLAMKRAFESMEHALAKGRGRNETPAFSVIVDGLFVPDISASCSALVKADSRVPEVMAASILAKQARDRLMNYYALFYPEYGFEKHKGYPTKNHRLAIARCGLSPIHRASFRVKTV